MQLKYDAMIPITKPFMPPRKEYEQYLKGIWEREYLTNNGPLVQELETRIQNYLDIGKLLYVSNGTMALQIAIKTLELKGEVITTPFSFVATTSSIVWEGCTPVFVDIDPNTLNIDPELIEDAITENTSAILATHVFGNPCDIVAINKIADLYGLKVIYDASHCFGTKYKGKSVYSYGDISTTSFHATKVYHTIEGGGIIANNPDVVNKVSRMRNFGYAGPNKFKGVGINGKNSEYHAAMGLCNLKYSDIVLRRRYQQYELYDAILQDCNIKTPEIQDGTTLYNRAYYSVIFESELALLQAKNTLENAEIFPRRYFYPSLNMLEYVSNSKAPYAEDISKRILCLPLFHILERSQQEYISFIIKDSIYTGHEKNINAWG